MAAAATRPRPGGPRSAAGPTPGAGVAGGRAQRRSPAGRTAAAVGRTGSVGAAPRAAKPSRLPLDLRSAMAARRLRAMARPSGRSEASRPASPKSLAHGFAGHAVEVDAEPGGGERASGPGRGAPRSCRPGRRRCRPRRAPGSRTGRSPRCRPMSAITVRAPFRTTTERQAAAASRAAATRAASSAEMSPSSASAWPLPARSRANSPGCGVSTAGRRSPCHQPSIVASDRSASASSTIGAAIGISRGTRSAGGRARPLRGPAGVPDRRRSHRARGRGSGRGPVPGPPPRRRPRAGPWSSPRRPWRRTAVGAIRGPRASRGPAPARPAARQTSRAAPA